MLGDVRRNGRTVVGDFNQYSLSLVAIGTQTDTSLRTCANSRFNGLDGILQQIDDHLRDQALICIQNEVIRNDFKLINDMSLGMLMTSQIHHPLEKSFHIKQGRFRCRNPGKATVILYKRQQPLSRTADGLQPVTDFLLRSRTV